MRFFPFMLSFLGIYLFGGRKIAVPYGIGVLDNVLLVILVTFILDSLQIPFYYLVFSFIGEKIKRVKRFREKQERKVRKCKVWHIAEAYGKIGVFTLAALPSFGGGIWTAVLLAFALHINKKISFLLIALGSLAGISLLALFSARIIMLFR